MEKTWEKYLLEVKQFTKSSYTPSKTFWDLISYTTDIVLPHIKTVFKLHNIKTEKVLKSDISKPYVSWNLEEELL